MFKKTLKASLVAVFAMVALAGCNGPKSATDVLNKAIENNTTNYHMNITSETTIKPTDTSFFNELTLILSSNADVTADIIHGSVGTTLKTDKDDVNDASVMQFYAKTEKDKTIIYQQGTPFDMGSLLGVPMIYDDTWQKSENDEVTTNTLNLESYRDLFKKAMFKEQDGIYYVGIKLTDVLENTKKDNKSDTNIDFSKITSISDTIITFTFDHDCNLQAIDIPKTTIKMSEVIDAMPEIDEFSKMFLQAIDSISISLNDNLSNHNKIEKIEIPQEIIDSAKTEAQILDEMTNLDQLSLNPTENVDVSEMMDDYETELNSTLTMPDMSLEEFDKLLNNNE